MEISQLESRYQMVFAKGKPTKRSSTGSFPEKSSCSSGGGGGGGGFYYSSIPHSPATSSSDEDEDMANCLILLAQGGSRAKLGCRKLAEIAAAGKAELFVYQCKTCDRTFQSFQALGGHRASHKKPKIITADDRDNQEERKQGPPYPSVGITTQSNSSNVKSKTHECSICGSEFASGQALGGHMRRHRPPPIIINQAAKLSMIRDGATDVSGSSDGGEKRRAVLTLDLNLPAPLDDDDQDIKPQHLAFSTPALVDCHY